MMSSVKPSTKYWGVDGKPLPDGLRNATLTEGKEIWLQLDTPSQTRDVAQVWLSSPLPVPPPPAGKGPPPPTTNKGHIPPTGG